MNFYNTINGQQVTGKGRTIPVYNPSNGEKIAEVNSINDEQATSALNSANNAFKVWSGFSLNQREKLINNYVEILEKNKNQIVDLLISETGKLYSNALSDYQMLIDCLKYFISEAKSLSGNIIPDYDDKHLNLIIRKPIGVVVGYLAWNFPLLNVGYKLGPVLASGCTCILKPSTSTPLATMLVGSLAKEAGIPDGVINIVVGSGEEISSVLNKSSVPKMITLIGSSRTGEKVIEESSSSIKKYSLELGGNAPAIVMKDADLDLVAESLVNAKVNNAGQVCVAPNRIFVHKDIKDEFIKKVKNLLKDIKLGTGKDEGKLVLAPMISPKSVDNMVSLVDDAVSKGATLQFGGTKADRKGYYFNIALLTDVSDDMRVYKEEIFGPIISVIEFDDSDNIIDFANDTKYGLAAYLYTNNLKDALNISEKIDAGTVCVNEQFFNYNLPHGGCKQSGIGKDCSIYSLEEYYYIQRISIKK